MIPSDEQNPIESTAPSRSRARWAWGLTAATFLFAGAALLIPIHSPTAADAADKTSNASLLAPVEVVIDSNPSAAAVIPGSDSRSAISNLHAAPTFNGRRLQIARTMEMIVTAYSPDERSCGKSADGITASGMSVWTNGMKLVAADTSVLPMKSVISIPGYNQGKPVPVLDRGGAIKGNRLDVLFPTHETARKWGRQKLTVVVWEYMD